MKYKKEQIKALAVMVTEMEKELRCPEFPIRGRNNEMFLSAKTITEIAEEYNIPIEDAESLTVDLSRASFDELSMYWKQVNIDRANLLIDLIDGFKRESVSGEQVILTMLASHDFDAQKQFAVILHSNWLKHPYNCWAVGGPLDCPFDELPEDEKAIFIQSVAILYDWLSSIR